MESRNGLHSNRPFLCCDAAQWIRRHGPCVRVFDDSHDVDLTTGDELHRGNYPATDSDSWFEVLCYEHPTSAHMSRRSKGFTILKHVFSMSRMSKRQNRTNLRFHSPSYHILPTAYIPTCLVTTSTSACHASAKMQAQAMCSAYINGELQQPP